METIKIPSEEKNTQWRKLKDTVEKRNTQWKKVKTRWRKETHSGEK